MSYISVPEGCFNLSKHCADHDELQIYAAFYLGLHCLPSICLGDSIIQMGK